MCRPPVRPSFVLGVTLQNLIHDEVTRQEGGVTVENIGKYLECGLYLYLHLHLYLYLVQTITLRRHSSIQTHGQQGSLEVLKVYLES